LEAFFRLHGGQKAGRKAKIFSLIIRGFKGKLKAKPACIRKGVLNTSLTLESTIPDKAGNYAVFSGLSPPGFGRLSQQAGPAFPLQCQRHNRFNP
jgi:hypothetical protein